MLHTQAGKASDGSRVSVVQVPCRYCDHVAARVVMLHLVHKIVGARCQGKVSCGWNSQMSVDEMGINTSFLSMG